MSFDKRKWWQVSPSTLYCFGPPTLWHFLNLVKYRHCNIYIFNSWKELIFTDTSFGNLVPTTFFQYKKKAKKCSGDEVVILEKFVEIYFHRKWNFQWELECISPMRSVCTSHNLKKASTTCFYFLFSDFLH